MGPSPPHYLSVSWSDEIIRTAMQAPAEQVGTDRQTDSCRQQGVATDDSDPLFHHPCLSVLLVCGCVVNHR